MSTSRVGAACLAAGLSILSACSPGAREEATVQTTRPSVPAIGSAPAAPILAAMTVYKSPTCSCCAKWVDHVRDAGFTVTARDTTEAALARIKQAHGVAPDKQSCHTAIVDGYVIEGHVPADDIRRLLAERPAILGLAAPGMPRGSPGMEGPVRDAYDVVTLEQGTASRVWARH